MDDLLERFSGEPLMLVALLFLAPFVLEEVAIVGGAAVAAGGELPLSVALLALWAGTAVSDWLLYAVGVLAARSASIRGWIGQETMARGQRLLAQGTLPAAVLARAVPWLLLPVFVACGFVSVGFARFALINAGIAAVYILVFFAGIYGVNLVLFELLDTWAWGVAILLGCAVFAGIRLLRRRYRKDGEAEGPR